MISITSIHESVIISCNKNVIVHESITGRQIVLCVNTKKQKQKFKSHRQEQNVSVTLTGSRNQNSKDQTSSLTLLFHSITLRNVFQ